MRPCGPPGKSNQTGYTVAKVIAFPSKVFREWAPISLALRRYLTSLGATGCEANDIIGRLHVQWLLYGLPLTGPGLRPVPSPAPREPDYTHTAGSRFHTRDLPRRPALDRARSLFELARLAYAQSGTP